MSSRAWVAAVAFGLTLLCGGALAQAPENEPSPPAIEQEQGQQTGKQPQSKSPNAAVSTARQGNEEGNEAAAENRPNDIKWYGDSDAWWLLGDNPAQSLMAWAAVVAAILTLIGVFLLGLTLKYTRKAANEASNATTAANETVDVTRDIGVAQTRAYLYVDEADCGEMILGQQSVSVCVNIRNYGMSPARDVLVYINGRLEKKWGGGAGTGVKPIEISGERGVFKSIVQTGAKSNFYFIWPYNLFLKENAEMMRTGDYQFVIDWRMEWQTTVDDRVEKVSSQISTVRGFVSNPPYEKNCDRYQMFPRDPQRG